MVDFVDCCLVIDPNFILMTIFHAVSLGYLLLALKALSHDTTRRHLNLPDCRARIIDHAFHLLHEELLKYCRILIIRAGQTLSKEILFNK